MSYINELNLQPLGFHPIIQMLHYGKKKGRKDKESEKRATYQQSEGLLRWMLQRT